jgi:hypothetical protein
MTFSIHLDSRDPVFALPVSAGQAADSMAPRTSSVAQQD